MEITYTEIYAFHVLQIEIHHKNSITITSIEMKLNEINKKKALFIAHTVVIFKSIKADNWFHVKYHIFSI